MDPKWLRNLLMSGAAVSALCSISDGAEEGAGGGGAPPADAGAGAASGDPPADGADEGASPAEDGADPPAAAAADPDAEDEPEPAPAKPKRVPWYEKRINQLTAKLKEVEGGAGAGGGDAPAAGVGVSSGPGYVTESGERLFTQAEVEQMAVAKSQLSKLNETADQMFDAGKKAFPKTWDARITAAGQAFGADLARRIDFFELLTDIPNGAQVYHELTGDLDAMDEVLALPPHKLGARLAKMSAELGKPAPRQISNAPDPIEPLDGGGGGNEPDLKTMPISQYAKKFDERRQKRYGG